ncbi:response regulator transcription factor [Miniphocaeibacter halophilus]|uniref:Response regulator transcription factor n=1 Tax=Miniphocaeibacter halophilus TaxID=2931922 RepID=A0AC61MT95_9FIRM|nr:response regulator transcription factor [Miniphocaeibacter halophilus]QQK08578.1 response regulator transcription factor [Miniphocaeibacter halophilus]
MNRIVIVEDDIFLRDEIENILIKRGYSVKSISSFHNIVEDIESEYPDLVILDINLPGISGFEICRKLKAKGIGPILILTSRDSLEDELQGLDLGGDDYLIKPCHPDRLIARANNLIELYSNMKRVLKLEDLKIEEDTNTLHYKDNSINLTENESIILKELIKISPSVLTKEELYKILWGGSKYVDENIIQVNITRLRRTLEKVGLKDIIINIRGIGYKLELENKYEDK